MLTVPSDLNGAGSPVGAGERVERCREARICVAKQQDLKYIVLVWI